MIAPPPQITHTDCVMISLSHPPKSLILTLSCPDDLSMYELEASQMANDRLETQLDDLRAEHAREVHTPDNITDNTQPFSTHDNTHSLSTHPTAHTLSTHI